MSGISVIASGMVTALGFNAPSTLAALRAGVSGVGEIPWADFESGEPLRGAKVRLPHWWEGLGKLAELVSPAIYECLAAAQPEPSQGVPILLGVADPARPGRVEGLDGGLLGEIETRLGVPHHLDSEIFPGSQSGAVWALLKADRLIESGRARACIVAGVDSYLSRATLDAYADRRRLMTPANSNGFFPGEAGCAVLVARTNTRAGDELEILGIGTDTESATVEGLEPLRGTGLTRAMKKALSAAQLDMEDISLRITDLSGEHYKFKEALIALNRLDRTSREGVLDLWHPIEYLGEIGAAIVPCLLAWAFHAGRLGYGPGPTVLCHVSADGGERAALIARSRTTS